jgi:hypothetical protein
VAGGRSVRGNGVSAFPRGRVHGVLRGRRTCGDRLHGMTSLAGERRTVFACVDAGSALCQGGRRTRSNTPTGHAGRCLHGVQTVSWVLRTAVARRADGVLGAPDGGCTR